MCEIELKIYNFGEEYHRDDTCKHLRNNLMMRVVMVPLLVQVYVISAYR